MSADWSLPAPPGFQGLRDDLPLTVYTQHLPHWRQDGATYFVTFRLLDSLPQAKLHELEAFRAEWQRRHPPPHSRESEDDLTREVMRRVEAWLDQGMGSCILRLAEPSALLIDVIHSTDGSVCELDCYVVMPNHVHAILRPLTPNTFPLEKVLQRWKGGSAHDINRLLHQSGTLWQPEGFDRTIRDERHLYQAIQYIGRNPRQAGLSPADTRLWIRPAWVQLGWNFEATA